MGLSKTGVFSASGENLSNNLLRITPKSHNASAYNAYQFNMVENMTEGTTYTISLWDVDVSHSAKAEANVGVWVYWGGGSINLISWYGPTYFTNGHADYLTKTFTITNAQATGNGSGNSWLNIYNSVGYVEGTMNMHIGKWKLEKGSTPSIWTPNSSEGTLFHGFAEGTNIAKIFEGHVEANEFIEF